MVIFEFFELNVCKAFTSSLLVLRDRYLCYIFALEEADYVLLFNFEGQILEENHLNELLIAHTAAITMLHKHLFAIDQQSFGVQRLKGSIFSLLRMEIDVSVVFILL